MEAVGVRWGVRLTPGGTLPSYVGTDYLNVIPSTRLWAVTDERLVLFW